MFQQVPLVEIDGLKLIQTKAILYYIAEKYNLHGKDIKERAMYAAAVSLDNLNVFIVVILMIQHIQMSHLGSTCIQRD